MTTPFSVGDEVTVVVSTSVFSRATVLECKQDDKAKLMWKVTLLVKQTGEVQTLKFHYNMNPQE